VDRNDPALTIQRLRLALDLFEAGLDLERQRLRRMEPRLSAADMESRLKTWLRTRPGAEEGDSPGRRIRLPE
jgi:hypothetical protein